MDNSKYNISFEDWVYVFEYNDEFGGVVTDWETIDKLRYNIREAMQLHFEWIKKLQNNAISDESWSFQMPINLSFSNNSYAFDLQTH